MKLNQPLIISFLLHVCVYLLILMNPHKPLLENPRLPVEIVYENDSKKRQIVMDPNEEKLADSLKQLKDQADRLSRITQRVKEQSIASRIDKTQNQQTGKAQNQQSATQQNHLQSEARSELQEPLRPEISDVGRNAQLSNSSIAEYIPEVRKGGFTALNTDQFLHYTFYARTNEQIRNRWISQIDQFLEKTSQSEINRLALKVQNSQVEIILNPQGQFIKALIHQKAENPGLDESAIMSFRMASPLNNPPSEMIEADGFIHLHYGFYLQFKPRHIASGSK